MPGIGSKHQYKPQSSGGGEGGSWAPLSDGWHKIDHRIDVRTWEPASTDEDGNRTGGPRCRLVLRSQTHPGQISRLSWGSGENIQPTADGKALEAGSRELSSQAGASAYMQLFEQKVKAKYGVDLSEAMSLADYDAFEVQIVMVPNTHRMAKGPKPQLVDVRKPEEGQVNPSSPSAKKVHTGAAEGSPSKHQQEAQKVAKESLSELQKQSRAGLEAYLTKHKSLEITPQTPALLMQHMEGGTPVERMMLATTAIRPEVLNTFDYQGGVVRL